MKYAIEMDSGTMIYAPSFIEIDPGIQNLLGEIHIARCSHKPTFIF
jgi:hypothetical protein